MTACVVCSKVFGPELFTPGLRVRRTCSRACAEEHRRRQAREKAARYYLAHRGAKVKGHTRCSSCRVAGHNRRTCGRDRSEAVEVLAPREVGV